MRKKVFNFKKNEYIKMDRNLYKALRCVLMDDQIGEFYGNFCDFVENKPFKEVGIYAASLLLFITDSSFIEALNLNTDKEGNIDWEKCLSSFANDLRKDLIESN